MNRYEHFTCRDWDEKLATTDPDMLTDEELDAFNAHIANCSRCASLLTDPEMDELIRENISLEEVIAMLPGNKHTTHVNETRRKLRQSIFIGLGAIGHKVVSQLRHEIVARQFNTSLFQYFVIDADESHPDTSFNHKNSAYLNISTFSPESVLQDASTHNAFSAWWGERSIDYLAVDESTRQMRATGRMHLFAHFNAIKSTLQTIVNAVNDGMMHKDVAEQGFDMLDDPPVVYLVFSPGDVTGSGLFLDIAYLIQELFKVHVSPEVVAIAVLPGSQQPVAEAHLRLQANAYAALQELEYYMKPTSTWKASYPSNLSLSSTKPPFSSVYLADTINEKGEAYSLEYVCKQVEHFLFWLCMPEVGPSLTQQSDAQSNNTIISRILHSEFEEHVQENNDAKTGCLPIYSSFGISHALLDWQVERVRSQAVAFIYDQLLTSQTVTPTLPPFLRNATVLSDTLKKELASFNNYQGKRLGMAGKITFKGISSEMNTLKKRYNASLTSIKDDSRWQHIQAKYVAQAITAIDTFIHVTLKDHGPVCVHQALEAMLTAMQKLRKAIETMQKQQYGILKSQDQRIAAISDLKAPDVPEVAQTRWPFLKKRPYISDSIKHDISLNLYKQYEATLLEHCYKHIITDILNPISRYIEQQLLVFAKAEAELYRLSTRATEDEEEQQEQGEQTASLLSVQPSLTEQKHLFKAIGSNEFNIDAIVGQVLQKTYDTWPFDDEDTDGLMRLQQHVNEAITQVLARLDSKEHLAYRLHSSKCTPIRRQFIADAAYMINFTETAKRWLFRLNHLRVLNYGFGTSWGGSHADIEMALNRLTNELSGHTELRRTNSGHELTLITVIHGIALSSLRVFDELHRSYELVTKTTAHAPYLHCSFEQQEVTNTVLSRESFSLEQLHNTWRTLLANMYYRRPMLFIDSEAIFKPLEAYYASGGSGASGVSRSEYIQVDVPDHPFFDVLTALKRSLTLQLNELSVETLQTQEVTQVLIALADMEALLFTQGWHKIDPPRYTPFNPRFHHRHLEDDTIQTANKKWRILEVESPGYVRHFSHDISMIRRAVVVITSESDDHQEYPVIARPGM